jgi:PAS domain S-box-containing protein
MPKPIVQVLLIEDNPTDVLLLREQFEHDALADFRLIVAERLSLGLALVQQTHFDVILLDLGLPDCQGLETFKRLHAQIRDVPVLVFSGFWDEQLAVQAVQLGAQDYLVKGYTAWEFTTRAIRNAIERHQLQNTLVSQDKQFRTLIENSSEAIALILADGTILYESPAVERILGYLPEELVGHSSYELIPPEDLAEAQKLFNCVLQSSRESITSEFRYVRKNGERVWIEATSRNLLDDPAVCGIVVNYRDVSERKRVEESVRRSNERLAIVVDIEHALAALLDQAEVHENLRQGILRLFPDVSAMFVSSFDAERRVIKAQYAIADGQVLDVTVLPELALASAGQGTQSQVIHTRQPFVIANGLKQKFHSKTIVRVGAEQGPDAQSAAYVPMLAQDKVLGIIQLQSYVPDRFTDEDVRILTLVANTAAVSMQNAQLYETAQKEIAERKRQEEALRKSEETLAANEQRLRALVENIDDGIELVNAEGVVTYASPSVARMLGVPPDQILGASVTGIHPDDVESARQTMAQVFASPGKPIQQTYRLRHQEGTWHWFEGTATNLLSDPAIGAIVVNFRDVTERKQAQALVSAQRDLARIIGAHISIPTALPVCLDIALQVSGLDSGGIYLFDPENRALELMCHRGLGADFIQATSRYPVEAPNVQIMSAGQNIYFDAEELGKQNLMQIEGLQALATIPIQDQGHVLGCINIASHSSPQIPDMVRHVLETIALEIGNIVVYLRTQSQLRESEARFRELAGNIAEEFWVYDWRLQRVTYVNPAFEKIWGRTAASFYQDAGMFFHSIFPADLPIVQQSIECQARGEPISIEYRVMHPDGSLRWVWDRSYPIFDDAGDLLRTVGVIADTTERKQSEIALRLSEEKYRGLMESLDSVIATVDYDGKFLYMNDIAAKYMGGTPQELIGKTMHDLFPEPMATRQLDNLRRVIREDKGTVAEFQTVVQGQYRWYHNSLQPIHNEHGEAVYALLNATDIHDLKTAQQELLELNRTLEERVQQRTAEVQDLYDSAPTGYHSLDVEGKVVMMNQTELNWLGYTREEMIGRRILELFTMASQDTFKKTWPAFKQQGFLRDLELEMIRKDGSVLPILVNATAIYNEDHQFVMSRSTLFDNTERKKAEQALRESEETYRALFETSNDAIFWMDLDNNYIRVNPRSLELLGFDSSSELLGRKASDFVEPSELVDSINRMRQLVNGESPATYERTFLRRDGTTIQGEIALSLICDDKGNPKLVQSVVRDITRRKQAEEALRLANAELEQAARAKDDFLANMSHELRTPLNAILGLSQSLGEQLIGSLNQRQLSSVQTIESSGRHLLELINDILDLSKIEAGNMTLNVMPVAVSPVCDASMLFIKEAAHRKQIQLTTKIDLAVEWIAADERRLKQMLVNLLNNAVKFTPAGGWIALDVAGDAANGIVRFSVRDTGIGIATQDMTRLFKPFVQLDGGLARHYEGTGLGLSLVARMAEMHGGSVAVESELGKGSQFTIALPWSEAMQIFTNTQTNPWENRVADVPSAVPLTDADAPTILIVEDNEANITTLSLYLQAKGFRVAIARHGGEALDLARADHPALILMDLQMPVLDGLEATRRLRRESDPRVAAIPVIALTALAMPGDRERSLAAGANDYLSKPVNLKQLVALINQFVKPASV